MDRRAFLKTSSLIAAGGLVPEFLVRAAEQAKPGDRVLVVVEMAGGNDGLNMVVPHGDDLYYKARPTLAIPKKRVLKITDQVGLHPRMVEMNDLLQKRELAVVLGVGYPNPNRSHFDSMDVWQTGDPKRASKTGWIGRGLSGVKAAKSGLIAMHVAPGRLPLALQGDVGAVSLNDPSSFSLQLTGNPERAAKRKKLLESLNSPAGMKTEDLAAFVRGRQLQVFRSVEALKKALEVKGDPQPGVPPQGVPIAAPGPFGARSSLFDQLQLIAQLINKDVGARIYYASIDGFDTHVTQADAHANLLANVSGAIGQFFNQLRPSGQAKRVVLMTYSEFGRRVRENGSKGTDHGAGSHLFVAGPAVKSGLLGKSPRLDDLIDGDLKFGIDFRRIYATLLDNWLGCKSRDVLNGDFEHLPLLGKA
jgi:uncharacterized protein (DUF1501 family)